MTDSRDIVSVERVIRAPAATIFDILADPARHPEIDGSGSVRAAQAGTVPRLSKGATFGMDMRRGVAYGILNTVTEFDEGRRIAWEPRLARGPKFGGRVWRYELEPVDGGTLVRETWDISREALRAVLRRVASARTREDMTKSLERLDQMTAAPA